MIRALRAALVAVLAAVGMVGGVGVAAAVDSHAAPYASASPRAEGPCTRCGYPEHLDYPIADEDGDFVEMTTRCPKCGYVEGYS